MMQFASKNFFHSLFDAKMHHFHDAESSIKCSILAVKA